MTGHLVADLGGVVFCFDHGHRLGRLAAVCGMEADRIDALLWRSGFSADCDRGEYAGAAAVRDRIRDVLAFRGCDDELDNAWCSAYRPDPVVLDVLGRIRGDRALALLTNNGPLEEEALIRRYPDVFARFDRLFFSHRLGCRKPDPAVFAAVAGRLGVAGDEIVLVDDSAANVAAARGAGWHAVVFHDVPRLRHDVQTSAWTC